LLVPPENPEALAGALARIADGNLRARLAEGARAASRRWNWSSYAQVLEELAARLVALNSPGVPDG
jgi:glycosyltransferase involved in cell wall biosynthesis